MKNVQQGYHFLTPSVTAMTDDELKIFKEALFQSKGRTNNRLASYLVQRGATPEEIVKFASNTKITGEFSYMKVIERSNRKLANYERFDSQQYRRVPDIRDTIFGKSYPTLVDVLVKDYREEYESECNEKWYKDKDYVPASAYIQNVYFVRQKAAFPARSIVANAQRLNLFDFLTSIKAINGVDTLPKEFLKDVSSHYVKDRVNQTIIDGNKIVDYNKWQRYFVECMLHTDTPLNDISPISTIDAVMNLRQRYFGEWLSIEPRLKELYKIDEFLECCKQMGIVLIRRKGGGNGTPSRMSTVLAQGIKIYAQYQRLVEKQMVPMSIAREVVAKDLNQWLDEKSLDACWRFITRNDIKDKPVKEVAKTSRRTARKDKFIEVDDVDKYIKEQDERRVK